MFYQSSMSTRPNKSVANIIYREFVNESDFCQCTHLQKEIFHLSDTHIISPLFLKLIARNSPPIGISMGVFSTSDEKEELLGFIIGFSTLIEKSIHVVMLGVKPELKNSIYGYKLLVNFREAAIKRDLATMFCVYEPLESNLARLYMSMKGTYGIAYQIESSNENCLVEDKLMVKWDLKTDSNQENCAQKLIKELIANPELCPIADSLHRPKDVRVLAEIPENYQALKEENLQEAINWRKNTREILSIYLNQKKYQIIDCITIKTNNQKKSYYLLERNDTSSNNL